MSLRPYRDIIKRETKEINVGNVKIGGSNPISVQSMTNTLTTDVSGTIKQIDELANEGADLVRVSCPDEESTKALKEICKHSKVPLIADIHFTPKAALEAAQIVEKVRINPGNYADNKKFKVFEFTDDEYENELQRIYDRFSPLVKICKENGTAMRIGTNHGSLSDRIMNRFGDTPLGMVESAMEFLRICKQNDYDQIVLSMKSSNPIVMIHAYRLLVKSMEDENMHYPLHLGVTEAGDGLDGRIKSALGIGTLLTEGIGDTIRVSLTEDPEFEIPAAEKILEKIDSFSKKVRLKNTNKRAFSFFKRETESIENVGDKNPPFQIIQMILKEIFQIIYS